MGGPGSGRYPAGSTLLGRPRKTGHDKQCFKVSVRLNESILAQAQEAIQNGERLPQAMIDHVRWNIERVEGKATVRVDAQVDSKVTLDPSLVMAAIAQAQADTLLLDAAWEPSNVSPNGLLDAPNEDNPCSISQKSALANLPPDRVSEGEGSD